MKTVSEIEKKIQELEEEKTRLIKERISTTNSLILRNASAILQCIEHVGEKIVKTSDRCDKQFSHNCPKCKLLQRVFELENYGDEIPSDESFTLELSYREI